MIDDPMPLADHLGDFLDTFERRVNGERNPVVRTGVRPAIPYDTRRAVYKRDGYTCAHCYISHRDRVERDPNAPLDNLMTLDHVVPWSAGGSDHGENLRTLCWGCNGLRSNYIDPAGARPEPVTWFCVDCYGGRRWTADGPLHLPQRPPWMRAPGFNASDWPENWPEATTEQHRRVRAYCAWCDALGHTLMRLCI